MRSPLPERPPGAAPSPLRALLALNGLLLAILALVTFGPAASAQQRARAAYTMAGGRITGLPPSAVYILDTVNLELIAVTYNPNTKTIEGIGHRNVAADETCRICADPAREDTVICVVEEPKDVAAIERTREFRGKYHVLGGAISPIDGIGPDQLRIAPLLTRIAEPGVREVILATDPNLEGEATATYLTRLLQPFPGLRVTRLQDFR